MITKIIDGVEFELTQKEIDELYWKRSRDNPAFQQKKAMVVRTERDRLLADTDWTALSDRTMTPEMAAYRQALRDITDQEGFPYQVDWPVKP